jgi:hypothetical protein
VKRLTTAAGLLAAFALALAGAATADAPTVDEFPVEFELTDLCPNLAPGTVIHGTGTEKSITHVETDRNGVTTFMNTSHASGTAVDQDGNAYVFNYANSFRVTNTGPGTVFTGKMTDSFSLAGQGPSRLHNGFVAGLTVSADFSTFTFEEQSSRGDPIDFGAGTSICDPL